LRNLSYEDIQTIISTLKTKAAR